MSESAFYRTIGEPALAEYKDRGSKFTAFAYPIEKVEDFKGHLQQLRKEHPRAVHRCFAYRIGTDGNNFRVSDDGEPAGTAGKIILGQIDGKQVTHIAIIVVRYFGGTLLGVPGLINAYKTVSSLALQVTPVITKPIVTKYIIHFNYTQVNEVMSVIKQCDCVVISQEMQLFCNITAAMPKSRLNEIVARLEKLPGVETKKLE